MVVEIQEDLLEHDIIGFFQWPEILDIVPDRAFDDGNTAEELGGTFQDPDHVRCLPPAPAPPHALEKGRDRIRGAHLHHQIEIPDINPQLSVLVQMMQAPSCELNASSARFRVAGEIEEWWM
jgi:hypothetical protein